MRLNMGGMVLPQKIKRKTAGRNHYHLEPCMIEASMIFPLNNILWSPYTLMDIRKGPLKTVAYSSGTVKRLRAYCQGFGARCVWVPENWKVRLKPTLARNRERGRIRVATAAEPWEGAEESDP